MTSETKEVEINALLKKKRDQSALVAVSNKGKHPAGQRTDLNQLDFSSIEDSEGKEQATGDKQAACLNPVPGLNRGIKRSLENLEQDRLQEKALIKNLGAKNEQLKGQIQEIHGMVKTVLKKQDRIEQLLHQVLSGNLPPTSLPRSIAPAQFQRPDNNNNK